MDSPTDNVPFTVREAATFWKVAVSTVRTWIINSRLQPVGVRRCAGPNSALEYRFGDLAEAERHYRLSGTGRPRLTDRR